MERSTGNSDFSGLLGLLQEANYASPESCIRNHALEVAQLSDAELSVQSENFIAFVIDLSIKGTCGKSMALTVLHDMFDVNSINRCERLFTVLEDNIHHFHKPPLQDAATTPILRMSNDLLKRLSRTVKTAFCGRILVFLSRFLPLTEKSGLNLPGNFNLQNITKYDTSNAQPADLMATTSTEEDDDMEVGEIKESKENGISVDHALYSMFWQLQLHFSNPALCFDKEQWMIFQKNVTDVVSVFSSFKLEKTEYRKGADSWLGQDDDIDSFFAKYLTSPKLLQLQLNDSQFRRYFLIQCLILFQFILSDAKVKQKSHVVRDEQKKFIEEYMDKISKLLRETHPKATHFTDNVKCILAREGNWNAWKNRGCPDVTASCDKQPMQAYKKRPRIAFEPSKVDMGSRELTRLWDTPNILDSCRNVKRKFVPELAQFLRDPIDEMDPEQQVDEEYKSVNSPSFQWRACRYLLSQSSNYIVNKDPTKSIPSFLNKVMYDTAKKMEVFKNELNEREEREARKLAEMSRQKLQGKEGSPMPDISIPPTTMKKLSVLLSGSYSNLSEVLGVTVDRKNDDEDSDVVFQLLMEWNTSKSGSLKLLRNSLLAADLLSADIIAVIKQAGLSKPSDEQ